MTTAFPLPTPDIFGPILSTADIRKAVLSTLQAWTPTYVAAMASRSGLVLLPFEDWKLRPEYRTLPVNNSPACLVTCLGTASTPQRRGNGDVMAVWTIEVLVVVFGDDWEATSDLVGYYTAAVRTALEQHRDLGGVASATQWLGEKYTEIEHSSTRTLGGAVIHFAVTTEHVLNYQAGPATPTSPLVLSPTAATASVTVTKL